jgi:hypothetical protein
MTAQTCDAIIGQTRGEFRFVPVYCAQTVGVRGYWSKGPGQSGDHFVRYCSIPGHFENCERRYPMIEGQVEAPDPIDQAKWTAERAESWTDALGTVESGKGVGWTDAGWTEAELRESYGR